jgi:hypothetical protein
VAGRVGDYDGGDRGRSNRRVFTNDDVARVPRTDVPAAQPAGVVDAERKPKVVDQQPPANAGTLRNPDAGRFNSEGNASRSSGMQGGEDRGRGSYTPPPTHAAAPPPQPVRQYTPPPQSAPVHSEPAPVHQAAPAPPPQRSFSPPAESHSNEGGHSGKPK